MFLRQGGAIKCHVMASKRYSKDLPQGGLEIPCTLTFERHAKDLAKADKLVKYTIAPSPAASKGIKDEPAAASKDEPANKKIRIEDPEVGLVLVVLYVTSTALSMVRSYQTPTSILLSVY